MYPDYIGNLERAIVQNMDLLVEQLIHVHVQELFVL